MARPFLIVLLTTLWVGSVLAANPSRLPHETVNPNVEDYVWKEGESPLPPYPDDKNLLEFNVDLANSPFRYYIDSQSVSFNPEDGIARYTLVIRSKSGGSNVSFEGMRCLSEEYKVYAYGTGRKQWRSHPRPTWRMIAETKYTEYRVSLWRDYLCSQKLEMMSREKILRNIKYGRDSKDSLYH